jgi:hypothetical protein
MEELERFVGIAGRPPPPVCGSVMVNVLDLCCLSARCHSVLSEVGAKGGWAQSRGGDLY